MKAAVSIVRRDLTRYLRAPVRTALMFAMPLLLAGIFALVFGGSGGTGLKLRVLLHDEDKGLVSRLLQGAAGNSEMDERIELVPVGEEGYEMMEAGDASALVHLPEKFSDDVLRRNPTTLTVVKNPAESFLPQVVEEGVILGAELLSQTALVLGSEFRQLTDMMDASGAPSDLQIAALSVAISHKMQGVERYVFPPIIQFESTTLEEKTEQQTPGVSILSYFLPGLTIFGILFLAQSATRDILRERESGLLRHLLTAPVTTTDYLLGKSLSVLLVTCLGFGLLIGVGLAVGATWGSPPAVILLMLACSLAMGGTLLFIMSLVRTERQGDTVTTIVIIIWGMLGGAFLPVSQIPDFLLPLCKTTLTYWATDAFMHLIVRGGTVSTILPHIMILATAGAALILGGAFLLRRKISSGVV